MAGSNELSTSIRIAMRAVLPLGVQVDIEPGSTNAVPTFQVFIRAGSGLHRFLAGWAGEGWPADVERLIAAAPQVEIVFGKRISQGAKDWLMTRHRGWVDESGDANVNLGTGLIILREGRQRLLHEKSTSRWTQTMIAAAEAVFDGVPPTVEAVEQATGISRGASNNALAKLEKLELLEPPNIPRGPLSARRVVDPDSFLDQYATAAALLARKRPVIRLHRLWTDPLDAFQTEIAPALNDSSTSSAITGGPHQFWSLLFCRNSPSLNCTLMTTSSRTLIYLLRQSARTSWIVDTLEVRALPTRLSAKGPVVNGIQVALLAPVYADLLAVGGRSSEAARYLRDHVDVGPHS